MKVIVIKSETVEIDEKLLQKYLKVILKEDFTDQDIGSIIENIDVDISSIRLSDTNISEETQKLLDEVTIKWEKCARFMNVVPNHLIGCYED